MYEIKEKGPLKKMLRFFFSLKEEKKWSGKSKMWQTKAHITIAHDKSEVFIMIIPE